jgi:hypothetical protein
MTLGTPLLEPTLAAQHHIVSAQSKFVKAYVVPQLIPPVIAPPGYIHKDCSELYLYLSLTGEMRRLLLLFT